MRQSVSGKNKAKQWQVIPCQGWDVLSGCDGVGSWSVKLSKFLFFKNLVAIAICLKNVTNRLKVPKNM